MAQPVNFTVHKNTAKRRRTKMRREEMIDDARDLAGAESLAGYVILAWDDNWTSHAHWDMGEKMPAALLPTFVKEVLDRHFGVKDAQNVVEAALKSGDD